MVTICLKTNQERLIKNLKHSFNPRSMLGELLQNARRAGASHIDIVAHDSSITIRDDGSGIADLQSLIHIGESGWDSELQQRENAFGMGVLSTLYFAEYLTVHSGPQRFSAATATIINGELIKVHNEILYPGTKIGLQGVKSPQKGVNLPDWVKRQLVYLCEAFPVRVTFNGIELSRPLADPALVWRETQVGQVLINLSAPSTNHRLFLQGLPLAYPVYSPKNQVIRLRDDVLARLPDRQHLLDEETDMPLIVKAVNQAYRQALLDEKAQLSPKDFIERYGNTCLHSSNADLLNDIHFALNSWFRDWETDPPGYHNEWDYSYPQGVVTEEEIVEKGLWCIDGADCNELIAEAYICARGGYLLQERRLDSNHWLTLQEHPITPDDVVVTYGSCLYTDSDPGLYDECVELVLVDSVNVSLRNESKEYSVSVVRSGDTIYLTEKAHAVTRFVSDYMFDNSYQETIHDNDEQTIVTFIAVGKSSSPKHLVRTLLGTLFDRSQPKLDGAMVQLIFDAEGRLQKVTD